MDLMEEELLEFVKKICDNLEEGHNIDHVKKVLDRSKYIYNALCCPSGNDMNKMLIAVAILHDSFDHKFDPDGKSKPFVKELLLKYFNSNDVDWIINIIDRISFSKENEIIKNGRTLDWVYILGENGLVIRDIVSDADKLEAIGRIGIDRCLSYGKYKDPNI